MKTIYINHDEWTNADYYQRTLKPKACSKTSEQAFFVYDCNGGFKGKHPESVARMMVDTMDGWTMSPTNW